MSIMNKEQISILTAPFLHHTFAYGLDSIEANGFRSIELWGASPHFCLMMIHLRVILPGSGRSTRCLRIEDLK